MMDDFRGKKEQNSSKKEIIHLTLLISAFIGYQKAFWQIPPASAY
jgi:hypothetical protein